MTVRNPLNSRKICDVLFVEHVVGVGYNIQNEHYNEQRYFSFTLGLR